MPDVINGGLKDLRDFFCAVSVDELKDQNVTVFFVEHIEQQGNIVAGLGRNWGSCRNVFRVINGLCFFLADMVDHRVASNGKEICERIFLVRKPWKRLVEFQEYGLSQVFGSTEGNSIPSAMFASGAVEGLAIDPPNLSMSHFSLHELIPTM